MFPSAHDSKFDRQLRLWGAHGQAALEFSHILVLGSSATASETLKNLVLPNVGKFTIVDDAVVTLGDCGQNFFVTEDWLGKSRAEAVADLLMEMNGEVQGRAIKENPKKFLQPENFDFFRQFQLIIITQLNSSDFLPLSDYLYSLNIPLIAIETLGLMGKIRFQQKELLIVESHPVNDQIDLSIHPQQLVHWPALKEYINKFPLTEKPKEGEENRGAPLMDSDIHSHIPYLAILGQVMEKYLKQSMERIPSTYEEKKQFKQFIVDSAWNFGEEGNFQEALEAAHRAYEMPRLEAFTLQVFNDPATENLNKESDKFWLLAAAVKRFHAQEGQGVLWPVSQNLPDMHSKTEFYLELKKLFIRKSEEDTKAVWRHSLAILEDLGRPANEISLEDAAYFVKNFRGVRCVRTGKISEEFSSSTFPTAAFNEILEENAEMAGYEAQSQGDENLLGDDEEAPWKPLTPHNIYWYCALRAAEEFHSKTGNWPGLAESSWESDGAQMNSLLVSFLDRHGLIVSDQDKRDKIIEKIGMEISRFGGCEPHITAAFMGGMGAQVALKVLMKQYVPINNTLLYNGIQCSASTLKL